ncbi:MAG: GntR family transcriptional regulator [Suipraeoptans sp.]
MSKAVEVDYNTPIYLQLRELVRTKIEDGEYSPGVAIPSEHELMEMYDLTRSTVRIAIDELVSDGLLMRVQGKGVYVVNHIERDLEELGGFTQTMTEKNVKSKTKILMKKKRVAGKKYASILHIDENDLIYHIKRLDYADNEPIAIEDIYIPYNLVPNFDEVEVGVFSLFEIYNFYGITPIRAWQTLGLTQLTAAEARLLDISKDQTVFLFSCTTYDENDRPIEYSRSYTRGDKCNFSVNFHKTKGL